MSTDAPPPSELIERLQRRRTRLIFAQAGFFLIWQLTYFSGDRPELASPRAVDHVHIGAYIVWAIVLLLFIGTGGGLAWPRQVKAILNDETTIEHRRRAMAPGFWAAMASAIGCYAVALFEPLNAREAIHTILTTGIVVTMLTFAALEYRAQKDG